MPDEQKINDLTTLNTVLGTVQARHELEKSELARRIAHLEQSNETYAKNQAAYQDRLLTAHEENIALKKKLLAIREAIYPII